MARMPYIHRGDRAMKDRRFTALIVGSPFETELTKKAKELIWKAFVAGGTRHSAQATTLPYIMRRCEREGIAYVLHANPGQGYYIQAQPIYEEKA